MNFSALYIMADIDNMLAFGDDKITQKKESIEKIQLEDLFAFHKETNESASSRFASNIIKIL